MAAKRPMPWILLLVATVSGASLVGGITWWASVQTTEYRIEEKRTDLKKLVLSGGIPPNQEVMDYLNSRNAAIEQRYQEWLKRVTIRPPVEATGSDPQLYFQEQFHEVQRTLTRLAAARSLPAPEQLGFPKELPPSDTVPRLLGQLALIQESASLIFEQGVSALASLKVEDPEVVPEEKGEGTLLLRLPVRVRLTCSLPQLMKILGALERTPQLIDVRALRLAMGTTPETLEVELVLCRHLVMASAQEPTRPSETAHAETTQHRERKLKKPEGL